MSTITPRYCPACDEPPRDPCYREKHIIACPVCGNCYSPFAHGSCIVCYRIDDPKWDHEFWKQWLEELSQSGSPKNPPVSASLTAQMDNLDIGQGDSGDGGQTGRRHSTVGGHRPRDTTMTEEDIGELERESEVLRILDGEE
ncbi:uncharacterized protein BJX67DRAFT_320289 [Aspergillus lucknowensis]|uniref:Uncharacterized protein n=1 Tax=Aspergillus lucknowensis TaxID=176173 RepID=A0ABR4LYU5_9EURO